LWFTPRATFPKRRHRTQETSAAHYVPEHRPSQPRIGTSSCEEPGKQPTEGIVKLRQYLSKLRTRERTTVSTRHPRHAAQRRHGGRPVGGRCSGGSK